MFACLAPCLSVAPDKHAVCSSKCDIASGAQPAYSSSGSEAEDTVVYLRSAPTGGEGPKDAAPLQKTSYGGVSSTDSSSLGSSTPIGHSGISGLCGGGPTVGQYADKRAYMQQHGRGFMAVSTLHQAGLSHFVMPGIGYIAYAMMFNGPEFLNNQTAVALSDPVCDPQHYRLVAEAFLKQHPKAMFVQVGAEFAAVLQELGFFVNAMGGETRLDVATYSFSGYARRGLRSAIASARKAGMTVHEVMQPFPASSDAAAAAGVSTDSVTDTAVKAAAQGKAAAAAAADEAQLAAEMQEVDAQWATGKIGRASQVTFINRRPIFAPEPGVRKLVARDAAGVLQGYIFFDATYEGGRLTGYYANVTRLLPAAHPGTLNLIMKDFLDRLRAEAHLEAPSKKLSIKRSVRKKQEAAAAAAAVAAAADDTANTPDTATAATAAAAAAAPEPAAEAAAAAENSPPRMFLSLGLSPFYQMDNSGFKFCPVAHKTLEKCFALGDAVYPARTLAAAKAKYGAGLHNGRYEDPAVQYTQQYLCHRRGGAGSMVALFDIAKLCGLWKHPVDAVARVISFKARTRKQKKQAATKL